MAKAYPDVILRPGLVVEFMQGNQAQLAWVLEESSGKARALTLTKREVKLTAARVLPWTGPQRDGGASRQEILDTLEELQRKRGEIQAGLDVMDIWELAQGEMTEAPLSWFADLIFDDASDNDLAALGRALLSAKSHFKFRPPLFEIHEAEKVEAKLRQEAEEKERDRIVAAALPLFKTLWSSHRPPSNLQLDDDVRDGLVELLKSQVAKTTDDKLNKLWTACAKSLPEHPHQALLLAQAWGVLPGHHNHLLDEAGYPLDDSWAADLEADQTAQIQAVESARMPVSDIPFVSIDGPTTRDIDDAFFIERHGDGYRLQLALARPNLGYTFGSDLDKAVFHRATSLYLPEGTGHMLPTRLGLNLFSLVQGEDRPAFVTEFLLDANGVPTSVTPRLEWVRVQTNDVYEHAEQAIANEENSMLCLGYELAQKLLERRKEAGASIIERPDTEIVLQGEGADIIVEVEEKTPTPMASLTVSEFMILTNSALGKWAKEHNVPLLYRTQNIALPSEAQGVFSKPEDIAKVVKLMAPPLMDLEPKRHAALAVEAYAPITSPIRRYADLINSAQVCEFLASGQPAFSREALESLMPALSSRIGAVGQIQRFRPRYWALAYLAQQKKQPVSAILADPNGPYPFLSIPKIQMSIRAPRKILGEKLYPGQRFQLRFGRIDPLTNEIKVAEALEE